MLYLVLTTDLNLDESNLYRFPIELTTSYISFEGYKFLIADFIASGKSCISFNLENLDFEFSDNLDTAIARRLSIPGLFSEDLIVIRSVRKNVIAYGDGVTALTGSISEITSFLSPSLSLELDGFVFETRNENIIPRGLYSVYGTVSIAALKDDAIVSVIKQSTDTNVYDKLTGSVDLTVPGNYLVIFGAVSNVDQIAIGFFNSRLNSWFAKQIIVL